METAPTILHLSLPVRDLEEARAFYVDGLGCRLGRQRSGWMDVWFWGMQLTLCERPDAVMPVAEQAVRHFGVTLDANELRDVVARLRQIDGVEWLTALTTATDPALSGKTSVKVADPSGNVVELKSYPAEDELRAPTTATDRGPA
jgi:extradiol dioxygenase family protein